MAFETTGIAITIDSRGARAGADPLTRRNRREAKERPHATNQQRKAGRPLRQEAPIVLPIPGLKRRNRLKRRQSQAFVQAVGG